MANKIPPPPGFGDRVRKAMADDGVSEAEFARRMKVSPSTINRWLSEDRFPSWGRLMKMAQALTCTTDYLLGMPEAEEPPPRRSSPEVIAAVSLLVRKLDEAGEAAAAVAALMPETRRRR